MTASKRSNPRSRSESTGRVTPKGTKPNGTQPPKRPEHLHDGTAPHSFAERARDQVHSRSGPANPRRTGTRGGR